MFTIWPFVASYWDEAMPEVVVRQSANVKVVQVQFAEPDVQAVWFASLLVQFVPKYTEVHSFWRAEQSPSAWSFSHSGVRSQDVMAPH